MLLLAIWWTTFHFTWFQIFQLHLTVYTRKMPIPEEKIKLVHRLVIIQKTGQIQQRMYTKWWLNNQLPCHLEDETASSLHVSVPFLEIREHNPATIRRWTFWNSYTMECYLGQFSSRREHLKAETSLPFALNSLHSSFFRGMQAPLSIPLP